MHLQQFQERKFQEFSGDFPWDPLMFRSAKLSPPQNILPSYSTDSRPGITLTEQNYQPNKKPKM